VNTGIEPNTIPQFGGLAWVESTARFGSCLQCFINDRPNQPGCSARTTSSLDVMFRNMFRAKKRAIVKGKSCFDSASDIGLYLTIRPYRRRGRAKSALALSQDRRQAIEPAAPSQTGAQKSRPALVPVDDQGIRVSG
jgi:hypothetical protein